MSECLQRRGDVDEDEGEESGPSKESSLVKPSRQATGVSDAESSRLRAFLHGEKMDRRGRGRGDAAEGTLGAGSEVAGSR